MLTMLCFLNPLPGSISIATAYRSRSEKAKLEIQNFRNSEVRKQNSKFRSRTRKPEAKYLEIRSISEAESGFSFLFPLKVQIFEAFQKALLRIGTPFLFWLELIKHRSEIDFIFFTLCILFIRLRIQNLRITSERNSESIAQNRDSLSCLITNSDYEFRIQIQKELVAELRIQFQTLEGNLEEISTSRRNYNNKVFSFLFIIKYA
ncbi:hypothetical protein LXL04_014155 [Taraxacum kok-saghyz]